MAKIKLILEDLEDGSVDFQHKFKPELPKDGDDMTQAQEFAIMLIKNLKDIVEGSGGLMFKKPDSRE